MGETRSPLHIVKAAGWLVIAILVFIVSHRNRGVREERHRLHDSLWKSGN
jgi:hypothetical protein